MNATQLNNLKGFRTRLSLPEMQILQLYKQLVERPEPCHPAAMTVRHWHDGDVAAWLALRDAAFTGQSPGVRPWTADDLAREVTSQPWWRPERMWLAEAEAADVAMQLAGSLIVSQRGRGELKRPALHWLMVLPAMRRRGIGGCLLAHAEAACWDAGQREIVLETHAGWREATRFYERQGYRMKSC